MNRAGLRPATIIALAVAASACASATQAGSSSTDVQSFAILEQGRLMATAGDCIACHTATPDRPFAGGRSIATPFGTLVAPNITPDRETGIGGWSDDEFVDAVQKGIRNDGAHLYPAMPYPYYANMNRDDVLAIRAFLDTQTPTRNPVQANHLPFPFSMRVSMAGWDMLFFSDKGPLHPAGPTPEWNRGAYLVNGPGHCGACHTEKNFLGADRESLTLQGGLVQGWFAPALTRDQRLGLGSWSVDDVVAYLKTGHNKVSAATGPMAEVVADSTSMLPDADLRAIAVYLKDQPATIDGAEQPLPATDAAMKDGEHIYGAVCSACHGANGTGIAGLFPSLKGNPELQSKDATTPIRVVLEGTHSVATDTAPTAGAMPAMGWKLSDRQIADVITYVRNAWGNAAPAVHDDAVAAMRKTAAASSD